MKHRHNKCSLPLTFPHLSLSLSVFLPRTDTISLSVMFSALCCYLKVSISQFSMLSLCFFLRHYLAGIYLHSSVCLSHSCVHTWMSIHTYTRTDVCGREWEGVSTILRSAGFDLFHLLLSHINRQPAGWKSGRDTHIGKQRHHSLNAAFRGFLMMTGEYTHGRTQTCSGWYSIEVLFSQSVIRKLEKCIRLLQLIRVVCHFLDQWIRMFSFLNWTK